MRTVDGHLPDLFLDDRQARGVRRRRPELLFEQLHIARDQIERRADLMRDVGGGLADRGELLGAGELLAQAEEPMIGLDELLVALLHLHGGIADARLQRVVEMFEPRQHLVEALGDLAELVAPPTGARAEKSPAVTRAMVSRSC